MKKFAAEQLQEIIADCVLRVGKETDKEKRQLFIDASEKLMRIADILVEDRSE